MSINAITTNVISNALHAFLAFVYFIGAVIHYLRKDSKFSLPFILFFLSLFVLKILGMYAHYNNPVGVLDKTWIGITLFVIVLNYSVTEAIVMPASMKQIIIILSVISSFLFLTVLDEDKGGNFLFIALPLVIVYAVAAYYTQRKLRLGFILIVISNILWITVRQIENYIVGHEILPQYRYDNDIFHLLLIISSFIIYKALSTNKHA